MTTVQTTVLVIIVIGLNYCFVLFLDILIHLIYFVLLWLCHDWAKPCNFPTSCSKSYQFKNKRHCESWFIFFLIFWFPPYTEVFPVFGCWLFIIGWILNYVLMACKVHSLLWGPLLKIGYNIKDSYYEAPRYPYHATVISKALDPNHIKPIK